MKNSHHNNRAFDNFCVENRQLFIQLFTFFPSALKKKDACLTLYISYSVNNNHNPDQRNTYSCLELSRRQNINK